MSEPQLLVIIASTRSGRFGERAAAWAFDRLRRRDEIRAELVDLRDYRLPTFDQRRSPARAHRDYPSEPVARWGRKIDEADGFLVVTPEYNHGYPAPLKNAIDSIFVEWHRKPVAFVGYGAAGAARAIEQLRLVAVELEMAPLRHAVHIPSDLVRSARSAERFTPDLLAPLDQQLDLLTTDLRWWAEALGAARARPHDPDASRPRR